MTHQHSHSGSCEEYSRLTRRSFLGASAFSAAAYALAPSWLPRLVLRRAGAEAKDTLLLVFLRGGADGLTVCVPYGDPDLYTARPTLAIAPPGMPNGAIDLNGFFGLAPASAPLLPAYQAGHLAVVHATGSPDPSRSHFDSMKFMELGTPLQPTSPLQSGWLARHLQTTSPLGGPLRALAVENLLPRTLAQSPSTLPIPDLDKFEFPGNVTTATERKAVINAMYAVAQPPLSTAAAESLATLDLLHQIDFLNYVPANGAAYPATTFGKKLKSLAALMKSGIGVECAEADYGGWDLHNQLGPLTGKMSQNLDDLTKSLGAFYLDLQAQIGSLVVVVMSEFGRRVKENASAGLDHGHGNVMLLLGGHIAGGQVKATWPGLAPANLDNGDLAITIDYRDILAEILEKRLGNTSLGTVFPNYTPTFQEIVQ